MITEQDLQEAIAECQGVRNPNTNTCIKLASYYTILNQMKEPLDAAYSYSPPPTVDRIGDHYNSGTEFMGVINSMATENVFPIMDDLMTTLAVINPKLYKSVIRKLKGGG